LAAALSAMPGSSALKEPPRRPVRILDEITTLEKRKDIGIIAETIVNSKAGSTLSDYARVKIGPKQATEKILSAMLDLDGLVAKSPFDRSSMVGILDKMLEDVFAAAEGDRGIQERSISVRSILREYASTMSQALKGVDFDTE
jgi:hypothetical protein